jgi:phage I-like protein
VNTVSELRAAFDNVLARLPLFDEPKRKTVRVIGMALPLGIADAPPKRIMVFPLGEPPSNDDRKWRFTQADLENTVNEFNTRTEPMRVLYEHGKGPRGDLAAGWIDALELASDGLYASVRWTPRARAEILAGEWGFRSPAWDGEEDGTFIYAGPLDHLSLVNNPGIGGMAPVIASSKPGSPDPSVNPATNTPPETAERNTEMTDTKTVAAASKTKAAALDKAGLLSTFREAYAIPEAISDDMCCQLCCEAMGGSYTPGADPQKEEMPGMPGASEKPGAPAVPFASAKAEDEAKLDASATAHANDETAAKLKAAEEQIAKLTAENKAHEARELSGKIINASAADRKAGTVLSFADRCRTERNARLGAAVQ